MTSILENGLKPRHDLKENEFVPTDEDRYDGINHLNLSIQVPNRTMLYQKKDGQSKLNVQGWVMIAIDLNILTNETMDYQFIFRNGASNNSEKDVSVQKLFGGDRDRLDDSWPTDNQSEIWIEG
ncbi:MAG: hypothetical protein LBM27_01435, partial [Lactobacillaceae bacterium]|nr:hypothetical protein [Lactobacillaceae bacterium]